MGKTKKRMFILSLVFMIFSLSSNQGISFAEGKKDIVNGEKVRTFDKGSLYKIRDKDKVRDVIIYNDGTIENYSEINHGSYFKYGKVDQELERSIKEDSNQRLSVAIWFKDIDYTNIEKEAKRQARIVDFKTVDRDRKSVV